MSFSIIPVESIILGLDTIGTLLIALSAIAVHHSIGAEHKIDSKVEKVIHREFIYAVVGLFLILGAFVIQFIQGL